MTPDELLFYQLARVAFCVGMGAATALVIVTVIEVIARAIRETTHDNDEDTG